MDEGKRFQHTLRGYEAGLSGYSPFTGYGPVYGSFDPSTMVPIVKERLHSIHLLLKNLSARDPEAAKAVYAAQMGSLRAELERAGLKGTDVADLLGSITGGSFATGTISPNGLKQVGDGTAVRVGPFATGTISPNGLKDTSVDEGKRFVDSSRDWHPPMALPGSSDKVVNDDSSMMDAMRELLRRDGDPFGG